MRYVGRVQRKNLRGFTLIELLVVIAIIAILAAILFPVFARARENARRASCMSNLKQIGLGMMMYMQDYDGNFPARYYLSGSATPGGGSGTMIGSIVPPTTSYASAKWILEPYTKSIQLAVCPSWTGDVPTQGGGYAYNLIAGIPSAYGGPLVLSEAQVEEPSLMIAFVDGSWYRDAYPVETSTGSANGNWKVDFCKDINNGGAAKTCTNAAWGAEINTYGRHLDGVNASYMDGHVKWNKVNYFYNGAKNYPVWQGWQ
jgi:prepilin-type N-terminal cleavage/methylation domain-containing protein/prepilin-type processing-associated H-X9-DG protein